MVPAVGKVTVADQAAPLGLPFPPAPSQPLAQRKAVTDPGSEVTLWVPPPFLNVTVSPALMLMALGEKVMSGCAVTTWFVAPTENESAKQAKAARQARTAITAPLPAGEWDPIALIAPMAHLDEIPWHHQR